MTRRLKDANDTRLLRDCWALEFDATKAHNVTHGPMYAVNTNYGKFFYEALIKPLGDGYFFITGKGGLHILAIGFASDGAGGWLINGHIDNDTGGVLTTVNFQSVDSLRHNEWAAVGLYYDKSYIVPMINGIPCGLTIGTIDRRSEFAPGIDLVGFTGGSDHNNGSFRMARQRLFETDLPITAAYGTVVRPAIEEMRGSVVIGPSNVQTAPYFLADYSKGNLQDSSKNRFNGYLFETQGTQASGGGYTNPGIGNRDLTKLPKWVIDEFVYSTTAPAAASPPALVKFYDSFGRQDVHYGKNAAPLHLGALEVGGVSWVDSGYGIIGGNAFTTDVGFAPAVFNTSITDVDVRMTRPQVFNNGLGVAHAMYLRYVDDNNCIKVSVSDGVNQSIAATQFVAGVGTSLGSVANFSNSWQTLKCVITGTTLNIYEASTLRGGPFTVDSSLTGTKVGFRLANPLIRVSEFAVF
jgi:hypothetical protein